MTTILLISFSLAIDAFSVSIVGGMKSHAAKIAEALKVAAIFGVFQAIMPVIGWAIGGYFKGFITSIDHWVAFILLGLIGAIMLREALRRDAHEEKEIFNTGTLLPLALATSIDAFIIGITLSLLTTPFLLSISTIGLVTFTLSFFGFIFGKQLVGLFGRKMEALGGAALILIGFNILIGHFVI